MLGGGGREGGLSSVQSATFLIENLFKLKQNDTKTEQMLISLSVFD